MKKPIILVILDGWGYSTDRKYNAIAQAELFYWKKIKKQSQFALLNSSGLAVGLPAEQPGNSEVGHLHLGAGEVVLQDLVYLNSHIPMLTWQEILVKLRFPKTIQELHFVGLCSDGGVHSHLEHLIYLVNIIQANSPWICHLHCIADGRDTSPYSLNKYLQQIKKACPQLKISTIIGRQYAMDRNHNQAYINYAYQNLIEGTGAQSYSETNIASQLEYYYQNNYTDETLPALYNVEYQGINNSNLKNFDNHAFFLFNFRIDRMQQITSTLKKHFYCATLTNYYISKIPYLFNKPKAKTPALNQVLSNANYSQLHISETEKFPHITYFFNGNNHVPAFKEDWICIPSIQISSYNQNPKMSALEITNYVCEVHNKYDFIVINLANADMIAHTGDLLATIEAIEIIDQCLGKLQSLNCPLIITSDHGNAECMSDGIYNYPQHTINPVPLLLYNCPTNKIKTIHNISEIKPLITNLFNL